MNLSLLLDMTRDGFGDRVLLGSHTGGITAEDLHRRSVGGARELRRTGATALVYLGVNGPAFPVSMFAAARAGVPLVPLNMLVRIMTADDADPRVLPRIETGKLVRREAVARITRNEPAAV